MYIRQHKLSKLHEYKYSSVDKSLISKYLLKPFYSNVVIYLFPRSMAPNLITLTGFGFVVINFLTVLWYNPNLDIDCPPWVYLSWAIGLFLYQTFDAIDGLQARRTRQSGPLGELFDHGVDALNTSLEVLIFSASMNLGQSWKTVLILFLTLLSFYVQTWEEYHTHTLTLGLVSGPVEGILTLIVVYAFTAYLGGASFWSRSLLETFGITHQTIPFFPQWIINLAWTDWYMIYGTLIIAFNTYTASLGVVKACRANSQKTKIALVGLLPFIYTWTIAPIYLYLQPKILHNHLLPVVFFLGVTNAYSVGRIIIGHLTKSRFPYTNVLNIPLTFAVIDSLGPVLHNYFASFPGLSWIGWPSALGNDVYQVAFIFMCLGLSLGIYGSFVVDVIVGVSDYLDISCLTIKHSSRPSLENDKKED